MSGHVDHAHQHARATPRIPGDIRTGRSAPGATEIRFQIRSESGITATFLADGFERTISARLDVTPRRLEVDLSDGDTVDAADLGLLIGACGSCNP